MATEEKALSLPISRADALERDLLLNDS